jgi:hypothetical protein
MMKQNLAILFSGGTDSLSLYTLAAVRKHPDIPSPRVIHLLCMLNGMSRFPTFTINRFKMAEKILKSQVPSNEPLTESNFVELDMGRLFQELWLDKYEELMPNYNGKNLVCVACKLAMHARAIIYCVEYCIPLLLAGYAKKQSYFPEQSKAFMTRISSFSESFGIITRFPVYHDFDDEMITRHFLEDHGLPSTGGGERKCLFSQTQTTATEKEIGMYLDDMIPIVNKYIESRLEGRLKDSAMCFYSEMT